MKKINFSFLSTPIQKNCLWILMLLASITAGYGQGDPCVLSVNQMTNVSLDQDCIGVVTPEMVGNTSQCSTGDIHVLLEDEHGVLLPDNTVTVDYIGQVMTVMLIDSNSMNTSWGYLNVEDKLPPQLECPATIDPLFCFSEDTYAPVASDNCGDFELIVTNISTTTNNCTDPLAFPNSDVLRRVVRSYVAVDMSGRMSEPCVIEFDVLGVPSSDSIKSPLNYLAQDNTSLSCDGVFPVDANGHPAPIDTALGGTGAPSLDSIAMFPEQDKLCNIIVDYDDQVLPTVQCVTKIMRRWTIFEWSCSDNPIDTSFIQMIEIQDKEGPTFACPSAIVSSTNSNGCEATVLLPAVSPVDNCGTEFTYNISWGTGFITTNGGLAQLPTGTTEVTYIVYDECGQPSEPCIVPVSVSDQTPPVAICDQFTTVSLTSNGLAQVPATVFDDGSYDECEFDRVLVRRMDTTCDGFPLEDEVFSEYIHFCCEDLGTSVMVVMRAYDKAGNFNDCMVNVEVQDKIAPSIVCPNDMEVNCDFPYDPDNLGDFFGVPTTTSNCQGVTPVETVIPNLNQCNIGTITRIFTVTTGGGSDVCTQTIYFNAVDAFNDDNNDIDWPADVTLDGCADPVDGPYGPDVTGFPSFTEGACDLVGANWTDQVFPFNNANGDACFKIIRTWKVIDWCQFTTINGGTTYPEWTHVQIIKVNDPVAPVITSSCERVSVCTFDAQCAVGFIELSATATDECTIDLDWSYQIDANNDGTFDAGLFGSGVGSTAIASGNYPVGSHRILWSFSDKCGNVTSCEQLFDVVNCKAPTPYCLNGLAITLMPVDEDNDGEVDGGMVELWAEDFDAGSSHPCGYEVFLSFEPVTTLNADGTPAVVGNMTFTCDTQGEQLVNMYAVIVTPEGTIIQDFCETFVDVQDNMGSCSGGTGNRAVVSGTIATANDLTLENAVVVLEGSEMSDQMTSEMGAYAFPSMPLGGQYTVAPKKTDDYRNGVNTLDLVMIQRHILGIQLLDSPYKLLAADVNSDREIKAADLLALRKLILGVTDELAGTDSWRFVDAAFSFPDAQDPFASDYPTTYQIEDLTGDMVVDFVAIKIGDVNDDAQLVADEDVSGRSTSTLDVTATNMEFAPGQTIRLPLTAATAAEVLGAQFTLNIDNATLTLLGVESDLLSVDENNLGYAYATEGMVTFSWNEVNEVSFAEGQTIATLVLEATNYGQIANSIAISSDVTASEAYTADLEVLEVALTVETTEAGAFALYQNTPNPFTNMTNITFDLPKDASVSVAIFDMTGKVVSTRRNAYTSGTHTITIDANEIGGSGIYYYQVEAGEFSATRKMVIID